MADKLLVIFVLYIAFQACVSEPQYYDTNSGPANGIWAFNDISAREEPLYRRFEIFEDGPPPQFPLSDRKCHRRHMRCLKGGSLIPTCAHHRKYGFISFSNECDILLENCLIDSYEIRTGKRSMKEPYYYNGQLKDCQYYVRQAYTIEDAVQLYYMIGRSQSSRRKATEQQTEKQTKTTTAKSDTTE